MFDWFWIDSILSFIVSNLSHDSTLAHGFGRIRFDVDGIRSVGFAAPFLMGLERV